MASTEYGAPFETHFVAKYYRKIKNYGNLQDYNNFKILVEDILRERPVMQWRLDLNIKKFYDELNGNISYARLAHAICLKGANKKGALRWGDKTPSYLRDLDVIESLFPNAKFVYIVRDGRDVALSLLDRDWGPNNIYACAKLWEEVNKEKNSLNKP